jgi:hypothetical protein
VHTRRSINEPSSLKLCKKLASMKLGRCIYLRRTDWQADYTRDLQPAIQNFPPKFGSSKKLVVDQRRALAVFAQSATDGCERAAQNEFSFRASHLRCGSAPAGTQLAGVPSSGQRRRRMPAAAADSSAAPRQPRD